MNRKLATLPIALLIAVAGCNQSNTESSSPPASSGTSATTSTGSTSTSTTGTSTTVSGGTTAGATTETGAVSKEVTLPNGLKYEDLVVGTGVTAAPGMSATLKYTGWLTDGTKFDSGQYTFKVGNDQVIQGWHEGVPGMKVGGKRKLTIPPALGYGDRGYPGSIPPGATLIFDLELVDVK